MQIRNWRQVLGTAELDPAVNVRIAPLTTNGEYDFYVTEILPGLRIAAHSHNQGIEIYQILQGVGLLYTYYLGIDSMTDKQTENVNTTEIRAGDFFEISAKTVHQLENTGNTPLILIFACPPSHLSDRIFARDLTI